MAKGSKVFWGGGIKYSRTSQVVQGLRICLAVQGDLNSIPGQGTKIPHALEQLSPNATTTEPVDHN